VHMLTWRPANILTYTNCEVIKNPIFFRCCDWLKIFPVSLIFPTELSKSTNHINLWKVFRTKKKSQIHEENQFKIYKRNELSRENFVTFHYALYLNICMLCCIYLYFLLFSKSWMLVELFCIHIHEDIYRTSAYLL